jgi:NAD+ kinase
MKVAIYGQYYQNSTEPIIKTSSFFFNKNNVELVIEASFFGLLYEKKL